MITNVNYTISCRLSRFVFKSIRNRWNKIINIAIINNVEEALLNYFLVLYDLYLNNEKNNNTNFKSIQAKHILGINIKNTRQIKKYFNSNILKLKILLVFVLVLVAVLCIPLLIISGNIHLKHGLEWNYFIGVILFYLLTSFFWKKNK